MKRLLLIYFILFAGGVALGQTKPTAEDLKAQKAAADDKLKTAGLAKTVMVETDKVILYTTWPEAKAKLAAANADKVYEFAFKTLKFEAAETPWTGKLTVFFLPERKEFNSFVRLVEQRKPEAGDTTSVQIRGKEPYILVGADSGSKATEAELVGQLGTAVAEALLHSKAGVASGAVTLPYWLVTGFGRLMTLYAEGNTQTNAGRIAAYKTKLRGLVAKGKVIKAADAWSETRNKENDLVSMSVIEFFVLGPDPSKFGKLLGGFKPNDERPNPTLDQALEAADFKADTLDAAWRAWVTKGK